MWSKHEVNALKNNYLNRGEDYISKIINKSPNAIRIKAGRLGIGKLAQREKIRLSDMEEQVILGGLLGDLYCRIKKTCKNAQIEGAHCKKQEPYLLWKLNLLKSLSFNLRRTKLDALFFESRIYPCLNYYHRLFYPKGKKQIKPEILDKVSEFGLAIWYMDDGSYSRRDKNCNLYTNGFTPAENLLIKKWFGSRWDIFPSIYIHKETKRYPGKEWHFLHFKRLETKKLINIIKNYIHPSMKYKIGVFN
ncbi:MAG: hypothetical protein AABW46_00955 [Nanoarchaeota archaeon]